MLAVFKKNNVFELTVLPNVKKVSTLLSVLFHQTFVKTAFLQGKPIQRTVFVKPPKEAKTDKVWELKKCVYGLADPSRYWYLKLREELIRATSIQLDQGIFIWYKDNKPIGIMACFIDNVLWAGNTEFENIVSK